MTTWQSRYFSDKKVFCDDSRSLPKAEQGTDRVHKGMKLQCKLLWTATSARDYSSQMYNWENHMYERKQEKPEVLGNGLNAEGGGEKHVYS